MRLSSIGCFSLALTTGGSNKVIQGMFILVVPLLSDLSDRNEDIDDRSEPTLLNSFARVMLCEICCSWLDREYIRTKRERISRFDMR
jgi:hypothetical protein